MLQKDSLQRTVKTVMWVLILVALGLVVLGGTAIYYCCRNESHGDIELPDLVPRPDVPSVAPQRNLEFSHENHGRQTTVTVNRETPFLYNHIDDIYDALDVDSSESCCKEVNRPSSSNRVSTPGNNVSVRHAKATAKPYIVPLTHYKQNDSNESRVPVVV